ncbi:MAG: hypothetical protein Q9227_006722 [Pyrenula ochraceoflavens]
MDCLPNILLVDAYDSFSASIAALLRQLLNTTVTIIRIDTDIKANLSLELGTFLQFFDAIVLGPGPGQPDNEADIGLFNTIWKTAERDRIPVLGICLGFQSLCCYYGHSVETLGLPCHGHAKRIFHTNTDLFQNVGSVTATQYNSLAVRPVQNKTLIKAPSPLQCWGHNLSFHLVATIFGDLYKQMNKESTKDQSFTRSDLQLLAWNDEGYAMAVKHSSLPFWGFQFHPESCKSTESCRTLLKKWWKMVNASNQRFRPQKLLRNITPPRAPASLPFEGQVERLVSRLKDLSSISADSVNHQSVQTALQREQLADLCYEMSSSGDVIMLESTKKARYCIYGIPDNTSWRIEVLGKTCSLHSGAVTDEYENVTVKEVLLVLERFLTTKNVIKGPESPFWGGLVGFMSYEFGLQLLDVSVASQTGSESIVPHISLAWIDRSVVLDLETGIITLQSLRKQDSWVHDMALKLSGTGEQNASLQQNNVYGILSEAKITTPDHENYISQIRSCKSELLAGNSYELCLTTEGTVTTPTGTHNPYLLYKNLQRHNPVPYAACLRLGRTLLLSSSPEKFLGWSRDGVVDMVPMKGTVKKTADMTREKATEILSTPKETAENLMIADLIRHDLYTATNYGDADIEVVKLCDVVEHETVYQLVSHIRAHTPLKPQMSQDERLAEVIKSGRRVLQCTLPPGSMTGAPKKRSCEILSQLERRPRGVYSGVVGYLDVGGGGSWSVCIRSAFSNESEDRDGRQTWHIGAGGAITVLSDDEGEWQEMITKLDSVLNAFR